MDTLFVQLKKLYDNELYDQVQPVVSKSVRYVCFDIFKVPASNKRNLAAICQIFNNISFNQGAIMEASYERDRSLLIPEQYFLLQMYSANSHFFRRQFRKAEHIYRIALVARKAIVKSKHPMSMNFENLVEAFPEQEVRYKIALCLEQVNEASEALSALNNISNRQRNLKINMMIGKLSMQLGKCQNAETAFKAVVRESPMNLEAMKGLLSLGVSELEISNIISESKWSNLSIGTCKSYFHNEFFC